MKMLQSIPSGSARCVTTCVLTAAGSFAALYLWRRLHTAGAKRQLAEAVQRRKKKTQAQKDKIYNATTVATAAGEKGSRKFVSSRIVTLAIDQLLKELADGRLTAVQVLQAFKAEACKADLKTNCITEYLEEADDFAKKLDSNKAKKPLHGLPISVKETFNLKGHDCTAGLAQLLDKECERDAVLIEVLKELGAVPFVRTNIPQTTCSMGTSNPIYGETVNPHCTDRIPGGSSGGEGALLAMGGSALGLGTDIGGSVRIPAAMTGIFSLKPTQNRLSGVGVKKSIDGITGVYDCPGLMSRKVQNIITVFRELVTPIMFQKDPLVLPIPFQTDLFSAQRSLTIGYYDQIGNIINPTPGCRRAVHIVKCVLEQMGHKLVPFSIPDVDKAFEMASGSYFCDGGRTFEELLGKEPEVSRLLDFTQKSACHKLNELITGKKYLTGFGKKSLPEKNVYEYWKFLAEREAYVQQFIETWKSQKLDAVIAPGFAMPGCPIEYCNSLGATIFVTGFYNFLNFPVGIVPVTHETEEDQRELERYPCKDELHTELKKATVGALGMPLGAQVVGLPWQEELVLRLMKDIEYKLKSAIIETENAS